MIPQAALRALFLAGLSVWVASGCAEEDAGDCSGATAICGVSAVGDGVGFCTEGSSGSCRAVCPGLLTPVCLGDTVGCADLTGEISPEFGPVCVPGGGQAAQQAAVKAFNDFGCEIPSDPKFDVNKYAPTVIATTDYGGGQVIANGCSQQAIYLCKGPYHDLDCQQKGAAGAQPAATGAPAAPAPSATGSAPDAGALPIAADAAAL